MFTGIVEHVGRIEGVERLADLTRFQIDVGPLAAGVKLGDSIAVLGVCLTVVRAEGDRFHVALIPHTLEKTTLAQLRAGDAVHLEVDVFAKYLKQYLDRVLPGLVAAAVAAKNDAAKD